MKCNDNANGGHYVCDREMKPVRSFNGNLQWNCECGRSVITTQRFDDAEREANLKTWKNMVRYED